MKASHVIICGRVYERQEKEPFIPSGFSISGALEFDKAAEQLRCHDCGGWFECLAAHVGHRHGGNRDYKRRHGLRNVTRLRTPSDLAKLRARPHKSRAHSDGSQLRRNPGIARQGIQEVLNERGKCRAQLLARLKQIAADLGFTPTLAEMSGHLEISSKTIRRDFGSWVSMCREAGLIPNKKESPRRSKDALIELIRDFAVANKRMPRPGDFGTGQLPSYMTIRRRFGTIDVALAEAGVRP